MPSAVLGGGSPKMKNNASMTSGKYTFNFETEVARARAEYPEETENITFIDLAALDAEHQVRNWHLRMFAITLYEDKENRDLFERGLNFKLPNLEDFDCAAFVRKIPQLERMLEQNVRITLAQPDHCMPVPGGGALIVIDTAKPTDWLDDRQKSRFFVFSHELGHAIVAGGSPAIPSGGILAQISALKSQSAEKAIMHEKKADTFAALRGLQNEILDTADVKRLASERLWRVLFADIEHYSSDALHALALSSDQADFIRLSPAAIKAIAADHAEKFSASAADVQAVRHLGTGFLTDAGAENLSGKNALAKQWLTRKSLAAHIASDPILRGELATYFSKACHALPAGSYARDFAAKAAETAKGVSL